jgi:hypothetical protein
MLALTSENGAGSRQNIVGDGQICPPIARRKLTKTGGYVCTERVTAGQRSVFKYDTKEKTERRAESRRKFLYYFPDGFHDETYIDWERNYKWKRISNGKNF